MPDAEHRLRAAERAIAVLQTELAAIDQARVLQASEYERRLSALNGENRRILEVQSKSVTAEKFDDYQRSQAAALDLALKAKDAEIVRLGDRVSVLENRWAKAVGIGVVLMVIAGTIGAAIVNTFQ